MEFKNKIIHVVKWSDLEALISEKYGGHEINIPLMEECGNDVSLSYTVKKGDVVNEYYVNKIAQFRETGKEPTYCTRAFLQDLVNNDVLPDGDWLIEVSW